MTKKIITESAIYKRLLEKVGQAASATAPAAPAPAPNRAPTSQSFKPNAPGGSIYTNPAEAKNDALKSEDLRKYINEYLAFKKTNVKVDNTPTVRWAEVGAAVADASKPAVAVSLMWTSVGKSPFDSKTIAGMLNSDDFRNFAARQSHNDKLPMALKRMTFSLVMGKTQLEPNAL